MQPIVMIAFDEYTDIQIEQEMLDRIGARIEHTKTILSPEAKALARNAEAIALTTDPFPRELIETFDHCKILSRFGTGLDNVDVHAATEQGIWVTNVPDAFVEEVSTHAIALLLGLNRHLFPLIEKSHLGKWETKERKIYRLKGQTLGLLGFGLIGKETAKKGKALGLEVIAYDPYAEEEIFSSLEVRRVDFDELLSSSDYLSLHAPATEETKHILNEDTFKLMKPASYLINTSRGALVDEGALLTAVQMGQIAGAALDVREKEPPGADDPLMKEERIVMTPHLGWCSIEAGQNLRVRATQAIVDVLQGRAPMNPVNKPK